MSIAWEESIAQEEPAPSARQADYRDDLAVALRRVCPAALRVRTHSGIIIPGTPVINAPGADLYLAPRTALADPYINADELDFNFDPAELGR